MTNEATTDDPNWDGHKNSCIGGNKGPCNCGATPPADEQKALDALDELYGQALEFHSLGTTVLYETVRAALTRDNSEALREALADFELIRYYCDRQTTALSKQGITSGHRVFEINSIWHVVDEATRKLNAALGG